VTGVAQAFRDRVRADARLVVARLWATEATTTEIGKLVGTSASRVSQLAQVMGLPSRKDKIDHSGDRYMGREAARLGLTRVELKRLVVKTVLDRRLVRAVLDGTLVGDPVAEQVVETATPAKTYSCVDCGKSLKWYAKRCRGCYQGKTEQSSRKKTSQIRDPLARAIVESFSPVALKVATRRALVVRRADPDEFRTPIVMRRTPTTASQCEDLTAELMGDPAPGRSALAGARPWQPYEPETKEISP
jgi:hypothetical protein